MNQDLIPNEPRPLSRDEELSRLAECANAAHEQVAVSLKEAVAKALEAGTALLAAKEICEEGKFTRWLKTNFRGGLSTGRRYMRFVAKWDQVGGDLSRAAGLSQRQIAKLLKGLPCTDGRANPRSLTVAKQLLTADQPTGDEPSPIGTQPAEPAFADGDPLGLVGRLLDQAAAELRRLLEPRAGNGCYAGHVLQLLEHIRSGLPRQRWFWNLVRAIDS